MKRRKKIVIVVLFLLFTYVAGYFIRTEVYYGLFQGEKMKLRLFYSKGEVVFWTPMVKVEEFIREIHFIRTSEAELLCPRLMRIIKDRRFFPQPVVRLPKRSQFPGGIGEYSR